VVQVAYRSTIGEALNKLGIRLGAGTGRLAQLVRSDQDLAAEASRLDKAILEAVSKEPSKRDAAGERKIRDRRAAVRQQREELERIFATEVPDYAALSKPEPLTVQETQSLRPRMRRSSSYVLISTRLTFGRSPRITQSGGRSM
jgi:hypothetical protein